MPRPVKIEVCPECSKECSGRVAFREHRYDEHGVHWDKRRATRGTQVERKRWMSFEIQMLKNPAYSLDVLVKRLKRSATSVAIKRKRVLAEVSRRKLNRSDERWRTAR